MKTRGKILIAVGVFLVLVAASVFLSLKFQPESSLQAYKQTLRQQGEKLRISDLIPPPVSPQSNSVDAVQQAFRMLAPSPEDTPEQMKTVIPGKAIIGWARPDVRGYDFTNSWNDFAAEVAADQPAVALLHEVLERPVLDFQLDYTKGIHLLLPHLSFLKRASQKLAAAALCEMHFNDTGAATTNIRTMLGFVQKDGADRLLISHLVRLAITSIAVAPTWELLQNTNASEPQLAALQQSWQKLNFLADAETSLEMERAWSLNVIQMLRTNHTSLKSMFGGYSGLGGSSGRGSGWMALTAGPRLAIGETMWRTSWSYSDELRILKSDTLTLHMLRMMQTNQNQNLEAAYEALEKQLAAATNAYVGAAMFGAFQIPGSGGYMGGWSPDTVVRKVISMETARRVVVTAIALRRFQLQHGKLPETLSELAPDYLPEVPMDPMDGKPLRYQALGDGMFLLYSVGENGVDDGGSPMFAAGVHSENYYWLNQHALDWVWPQPATEAEVRAYYQKQAENSN